MKTNKLFPIFALTLCSFLQSMPEYQLFNSIKNNFGTNDIEVQIIENKWQHYQSEFQQHDEHDNNLLHIIASSLGVYLADRIIKICKKVEPFIEQNSFKETPLMCAVKANNTALIPLLHPALSNDSPDAEGYTPEHIAVLYMKDDCMEAFFKDKYYSISDTKDALFDLTPYEMLEKMESYQIQYVPAKPHEKQILEIKEPIYKKIAENFEGKALNNDSLENMKKIFQQNK